MALLGLSIDK